MRNAPTGSSFPALIASSASLPAATMRRAGSSALRTSGVRDLDLVERKNSVAPCCSSHQDKWWLMTEVDSRSLRPAALRLPVSAIATKTARLRQSSINFLIPAKMLSPELGQSKRCVLSIAGHYRQETGDSNVHKHRQEHVHARQHLFAAVVQALWPQGSAAVCP
jgi:hypothetical protein